MPEEITRREIVLTLLDMIDHYDKRLVLQVEHCRPYTFVKITDTETSYSTVGFSKVCWPDKWNKIRGRQIAIAKAVQKLAELLEATING